MSLVIRVWKLTRQVNSASIEQRCLYGYPLVVWVVQRGQRHKTFLHLRLGTKFIQVPRSVPELTASMVAWLDALKCQSPSDLLGLVPMPSRQALFQTLPLDTLPLYSK